MDQKTRSAVLNKDMNRAELPVHPRASQKPRPTIHAPVKKDPVDELIDRAMNALARDEAETAERTIENVNEFLLTQVAGVPISEIRHDG